MKASFFFFFFFHLRQMLNKPNSSELQSFFWKKPPKTSKSQNKPKMKLKKNPKKHFSEKDDLTNMLPAVCSSVEKEKKSIIF